MFQDTDIPTRIIKENSDLFAHFIIKDYNDKIVKSEFPQTMKNANHSTKNEVFH